MATAADARTDHRHPGVATLATEAGHLELSRTVRKFFETSARSEQRPVLVTRPGTTLSPFVVAWLRDLAGYWTVEMPDRRLREVQTGRVVSGVLDLVDPDGWTDVAEPSETEYLASTIAVDVVLEHRADESTRIGASAAVVQAALGAAAPAVWGTSEPLADRWDVEALTRWAQSAMPLTGPVYWRGEDGWGEIAVARSERGVVERLRSGVAHDGAPATALPRAVQALESLAASRSPILTCAISALGAETDQRARAGAQAPERPLAALLGPTTLGRQGWEASETAAAVGGSLVGRTRLPGLLVRFDGTLDQARARYLDLVTLIQQADEKADR